MELTAVVAFENFLARFNRGFAVEPFGFSQGAVCPLPDHRAPAPDAGGYTAPLAGTGNPEGKEHA